VSHPFARITIRRCVMGPIAAVPGATVNVRDSVIDASDAEAIAYCGLPGDADTPGGMLRLQACTVIGRVHAAQVDDISNSLLLGRAPGQRRQDGCVRYTYLPDGSRTSPPYRCQPAGGAARPVFTSLRFGDPGYGQLRAGTVDAIRRGADNDSEMGAGNQI